MCMVAERSFLLDADSGYAGSEYEEGGGELELMELLCMG